MWFLILLSGGYDFMIINDKDVKVETDRFENNTSVE